MAHNQGQTAPIQRGIDMEQHFTVTGMTCGHCEMAVKRAILSVDPNAQIQIDRQHNDVQVNSPHDANALMSAIAQAGYTANPVRPA